MQLYHQGFQDLFNVFVGGGIAYIFGDDGGCFGENKKWNFPEYIDIFGRKSLRETPPPPKKKPKTKQKTTTTKNTGLREGLATLSWFSI